MKPARIIRCLPISVAVLGCCVTAGCERSPRLVNVAPPEVSVSRPVEREVTEYFEATGQTVAVEAVEIRARVPGHLTEVNFKEGTEVLQGDVLFQIDPRPFEAELAQAEAELASARAQLKRAEADVARTRALVPKGASSLRDLETGVAAKETAEANIKAAQAHIDQAKLQLEWSRITAPISGRISRANVTAGNLIQLVGTSSDVLTTIVTTAPMYVYFDADEGEMLRQQDAFRKRGLAPRPSDIKSLEIPVWMALATERGFAYEGVLDFLDRKSVV